MQQRNNNCKINFITDDFIQKVYVQFQYTTQFNLLLPEYSFRSIFEI